MAQDGRTALVWVRVCNYGVQLGWFFAAKNASFVNPSRAQEIAHTPVRCLTCAQSIGDICSHCFANKHVSSRLLGIAKTPVAHQHLTNHVFGTENCIHTVIYHFLGLDKG